MQTNQNTFCTNASYVYAIQMIHHGYYSTSDACLTKYNLYILISAENVTWYPDVVTLPSIESATGEYGLLQMFFPIWFALVILYDQAFCFYQTNEEGELFAPIRPYHPMSNGMLEEFNGA